MICAEIITKTRFEAYLKNVIINRTYLERLMLFFDSIKDISIHEKIMFLLYNEYVSLYAILYDAYDENTKTFDISAINAIISAHANKFKLPYSYTRDVFFRDYVTTLTFEHYQDRENIKHQLDIIFESLSSNEVTFLLDTYGITKDNFMDLTRLQVNNESIELSEIEKRSETLNKITSMLSGIKSYEEDSAKNVIVNEDVDTLISILNKISLGTIH